MFCRIHVLLLVDALVEVSGIALPCCITIETREYSDTHTHTDIFIYLYIYIYIYIYICVCVCVILDNIHYFQI